MGRPLYIAFLFTVHLTFIAGAVLLTSPLMTGEVKQADQDAEAATYDQSEFFAQVSTNTRKAQDATMLPLQSRYQQKGPGEPLGPQQASQWARADGQLRDGSLWNTRRLAP